MASRARSRAGISALVVTGARAPVAAAITAAAASVCLAAAPVRRAAAVSRFLPLPLASPFLPAVRQERENVPKLHYNIIPNSEDYELSPDKALLQTIIVLFGGLLVFLVLSMVLWVLRKLWSLRPSAVQSPSLPAPALGEVVVTGEADTTGTGVEASKATVGTQTTSAAAMPPHLTLNFQGDSPSEVTALEERDFSAVYEAALPPSATRAPPTAATIGESCGPTASLSSDSSDDGAAPEVVTVSVRDAKVNTAGMGTTDDKEAGAPVDMVNPLPPGPPLARAVRFTEDSLQRHHALMVSDESSVKGGSEASKSPCAASTEASSSTLSPPESAEMAISADADAGAAGTGAESNEAEAEMQTNSNPALAPLSAPNCKGKPPSKAIAFGEEDTATADVTELPPPSATTAASAITTAAGGKGGSAALLPEDGGGCCTAPKIGTEHVKVDTKEEGADAGAAASAAPLRPSSRKTDETASNGHSSGGRTRVASSGGLATEPSPRLPAATKFCGGIAAFLSGDDSSGSVPNGTESAPEGNGAATDKASIDVAASAVGLRHEVESMNGSSGNYMPSGVWTASSSSEVAPGHVVAQAVPRDDVAAGETSQRRAHTRPPAVEDSAAPHDNGKGNGRLDAPPNREPPSLPPQMPACLLYDTNGSEDLAEVARVKAPVQGLGERLSDAVEVDIVFRRPAKETASKVLEQSSRRREESG